MGHDMVALHQEWMSSKDQSRHMTPYGGCAGDHWHRFLVEDYVLGGPYCAATVVVGVVEVVA